MSLVQFYPYTAGFHGKFRTGVAPSNWGPIRPMTGRPAGFRPMRDEAQFAHLSDEFIHIYPGIYTATVACSVVHRFSE